MMAKKGKGSSAGKAVAAALGIAGAAWAGHLVRRRASVAIGERDREAVSNEVLYRRGLVPVAKSGWTKTEGLAPPWPVLAESLDTDVLVVGAGLAGSSLALHLAEAGVGVVLLEARQPGWGASGRNAGHVLPTLRDRKLFRRWPDGGKAFFAAFRAQHTIPYDIAQKYHISCDAVRAGYLNALKGQRAFDNFMAKAADIAELGFGRVVTLGASDMVAATGSRCYSHGVLFEDGGRVNPYLLTNGMVKAAAGLGARVFGGSEALRIARTPQGWQVETAKGSVAARRVVFCTAAFPTGIVPAFAKAFQPLGAYALSTKPLPEEARARILPQGMTFAEAPVDLHPLVKDGYGRLVLSSLPTSFNAADVRYHFRTQLDWIHATWPETRGMPIELEAYWTGRVAMRGEEFPGVYEVEPGLMGLMHFNAWGNVMAPLMGKLLAEGLVKDRLDTLPFPIGKPKPVRLQGMQDILFRDLLLPAARLARKAGVV